MVWLREESHFFAATQWEEEEREVKERMRKKRNDGAVQVG
jgi:hypothetical protein